MNYFNLLFISIFLFASTAIADPEVKGKPNELIKYLKANENTVTISAQATHEVEADQAVALISIITENGLLKKALEQNLELRKKIINKLTKDGISSKKITGTKFSSTPQYGFFEKKPSNYKVENVMKIIVSSEIEFQYVASIIDSYDEVFYRELQYDHGDTENYRLAVLNKAHIRPVKKY